MPIAPEGNSQPYVEQVGPGNDEGPSEQILKIMDMRSISIKNMKWKFGNMYQIFSTMLTIYGNVSNIFRKRQTFLKLFTTREDVSGKSWNL